MDYPFMVNLPWKSTYHMDPNFYGSPSFKQSYRCFQFKHPQHSHLQSGDNIILPESALLRLSHMDIQYPMLFHLRSPEMGRVSYCGVVEFSSKEGEEATSRCSPTRPILYIFPNPKSILESTLIRGFTCLSAGDTMHEGKKFYIDVLETKTAAAIRVNDTDCEVDFALPLDYKEPEKVKLADKLIEKASMEAGKKEKQVVVADDEEPKFRPFMGVPCSKVVR
ncbi:hypothetical protein FEM48_Zijuj04G0167800 [Ziziphus jujuba var. spinosa]|uniref:Ubiquitin fusion degradation protein 1 homolog n=1 Tax=Ziziphus jujuba var. spinosa TaxID=714518 RepID=A0A978VL08_ZIZJJ|nr:hypothetical protein FEM48_Zijuj04G0167800 [Ziziphus jujuba var. spinosa]